MKLTPEQKVEIRLLSDGKLYRKAQELAGKHSSIKNTQLEGLLEFSRSWEELTGFVKHQKEDRDWSSGSKAHYLDFYTALDTYLDDLCRDVKEQALFVPEGLVKRETRKRTSFFAGLLAREFIQHLVAEMLWQEEVKG